MYIFVSTPIVCVSQLFRFEQFLMWCATEKSTIIRLIETAFERIYNQLEYLLQHGVDPIFHFGGSEQATPPMMSPKLYNEFVVKYDSKFFDLVHRHGGIVAVHCHGRLRGIKEKFILATTAGSQSPVSCRLRDNYIQFIESRKDVGHRHSRNYP